MQLNITPATLDVLNETANRTGISKTMMAERVFEWFASQEELIQLRVLGVLTDELSSKLGQMILQEMVNRSPPEEQERQAS